MSVVCFVWVLTPFLTMVVSFVLVPHVEEVTETLEDIFSKLQPCVAMAAAYIAASSLRFI